MRMFHSCDQIMQGGQTRASSDASILLRQTLKRISGGTDFEFATFSLRLQSLAGLAEVKIGLHVCRSF